MKKQKIVIYAAYGPAGTQRNGGIEIDIESENLDGYEAKQIALPDPHHVGVLFEFSEGETS